MKRAATCSGFAALVLAACCALAPSASAAQASFTSGFKLQRGRYHVTVANFSSSVFLAVETGAVKSQTHAAATTYVAHGTATESRLQASFGEFGELSMRFHPAPGRSWVKPHRRCHGLGRFVLRKGVWKGRLRFRGEDGYLTLDVHRAKGSVEALAPQCRKAGHGGKHHGHRHHRSRRRIRGERLSPAKPVAVRPTQEPALGPEVPVLQARWRDGIRAAAFVGGASREGSTFFASSEEARGNLAIFRTARAEGKGAAFGADHALTRAALSPPAPFHGTGRYLAAPDGSTAWDGGLFVSFPGAPHYNLTGEPFEPSLQLFPELLVGLMSASSARHHRPVPPCFGPTCRTPLGALSQARSRRPDLNRGPLHYE